MGWRRTPRDSAAPVSSPAAQALRLFYRLAERSWRASVVEVARVIAVLRRRARERGPFGFSLAIVLCVVISAVSFLDHRYPGQQWLTACCAERDGYPLRLWLVRLPGSLLAPAPDLAVWGSVAQILIVVGLAEAAAGRLLTVSVALAGHVISTLAARALIVLGPGVLGGLPPIDRHVLDTGPSAATVALIAYLVVVLRCPILGTLAAAGLSVAMLAHSDLAGREHLVAWLVGMACGAIQLLALRRRAARASVRDVDAGRASLVTHAER
jgi:hypothetical protein